jgi:hypothetical protein
MLSSIGLTNASIGCMVSYYRKLVALFENRRLTYHSQALIVFYYGGSLVVKNEMTGGDLMT